MVAVRQARLGMGSAWWADRIRPAAALAERGDLDHLLFETMAEATISASQVRRRADPAFPAMTRLRRAAARRAAGLREAGHEVGPVRLSSEREQDPVNNGYTQSITWPGLREPRPAGT